MAEPNNSNSSPPPEKSQLLSATYKSPTNDPFTLTHKLPALTTSKPADRVKYLASLREAVSSIQEEINKNLTSRMEEDKARDIAASNGAKAKVDEAKEEDNYGEEVPEEED